MIHFFMIFDWKPECFMLLYHHFILLYIIYIIYIIYIYIILYIYIYVCIKIVWRKDACIQLKFHALCNHQVYYLCHALKIRKIYAKINTSRIHQVMKSKRSEFSIKVVLLLKISYFRLKLFSNNLTSCLHQLINSFLLFNTRLSLKCSIRWNFSAEYSGQNLILGLL